MGTVIVRQPDGKLASFGTEEDNFLAWDMTREEAFAYCREDLDLGREASERKVQAGVDDIMPLTTRPGDGLARWRDSLEAFSRRHLEKDLKALLTELGFPGYAYRDVVSEFADPEDAEPYSPATLRD